MVVGRGRSYLRRHAVTSAALIALAACAAVDGPPSIPAIADREVLLGDVAQVPFTVADEDTASLVLSVISGDEGVVADSALVITGSNGSYVLAATPSSVGTAEVTIAARDASGQEAQRSFDLTVTQPFAEQSRLTADDAEEHDMFGLAVAVQGDRVVVGAPDDKTAGRGSTYVYELDGDAWSQVQTLFGDDLANDYFGIAVALDGDRLLVGATFDDHETVEDAGTVFVFEHDGTSWDMVDRLVADDPSTEALFGDAVALDGDRALVTARFEDHGGGNYGSVYVFDHTGAGWDLADELVREAPADDQFGYALALEGDRAVVGSFPGGGPVMGVAGSAFVYELDGGDWNVTKELRPDDLEEDIDFGCSVDLEGDRVVVGAADRNGSDTRSYVYVFERVGGVWQQVAKLRPEDDAVRSNWYGCSVALSGGRILVGDTRVSSAAGFNSGAAYVFDLIGSTWVQTAILKSEPEADGALFGTAVALDGGRAVIGAFAEDTEAAEGAGTAYVFER